MDHMRLNPLRAARRDLGLTQVQLAEKAGLSQYVISHLESGGAAGKGAAQKLRKVVGERVSLEWLLGIGRSTGERTKTAATR